MQISQFTRLARAGAVTNMRFIESGCSPLVLECQYEYPGDDNHVPMKALLENDQGDIMTCQNITQAYDICRKAGLHKAELVQVIPHDEACTGLTLRAEQQAIPLVF